MANRPAFARTLKAIDFRSPGSIGAYEALRFRDDPEFKEWDTDPGLQARAFGYWIEFHYRHGLAYVIHSSDRDGRYRGQGCLGIALLNTKDNFPVYDGYSAREIAGGAHIGISVAEYLDGEPLYALMNLRDVKADNKYYGFALAIIGRIQVETGEVEAGVESLKAAFRAGIRGQRAKKAATDIVRHVEQCKARSRFVLPLPRPLRLSGAVLVEL